MLDLARVIGVSHDIELVTDSFFGRSVHFPNEVLFVDWRGEFPWRVLDHQTWALVQEAEELDRET